MNIPGNIRSAVAKSEHDRKIDQLAKQFRSTMRHEPYPRKKHLVKWMFESNVHLADQVWNRFMAA